MWRKIWPDRLGGQIALLLSLALALEFVGTEWISERVGRSTLLAERATELSGHMMVAQRLLMTTPRAERQERLDQLWSGTPSFFWFAAPVAAPASSTVTASQLKLIRNSLEPDFPDLRLAQRDGDLYGTWRLADGSIAGFRSDMIRRGAHSFERRLGSLTMLVLAVALVANMFARKISLPLRKLSDHADGIGHAQAEAAQVEGPIEVRQVARAYNDMQVRMAAQLEERLQALAAVSHDLRTPIARMSLRTSKVEDAEIRRQMTQDLGEMEAFIGSLLDYLSGADPEVDQLVNVASMLMTIVYGEQDLGHKAEYFGPASLEIWTKPVKLQRVVLNLVQNAVRHGGRADVHLALRRAQLEILVEDDGAGIAEDQLENVFEPFARLEGSRNRETGGVGLGLAIVKRSVGKLGGTIRLENRTERGLRARILLPIAAGDNAKKLR